MKKRIVIALLASMLTISTTVGAINASADESCMVYATTSSGVAIDDTITLTVDDGYEDDVDKQYTGKIYEEDATLNCKIILMVYKSTGVVEGAAFPGTSGIVEVTGSVADDTVKLDIEGYSYTGTIYDGYLQLYYDESTVSTTTETDAIVTTTSAVEETTISAEETTTSVDVTTASETTTTETTTSAIEETTTTGALVVGDSNKETTSGSTTTSTSGSGSGSTTTSASSSGSATTTTTGSGSTTTSASGSSKTSTAVVSNSGSKSITSPTTGDSRSLAAIVLTSVAALGTAVGVKFRKK